MENTDYLGRKDQPLTRKKWLVGAAMASCAGLAGWVGSRVAGREAGDQVLAGASLSPVKWDAPAAVSQAAPDAAATLRELAQARGENQLLQEQLRQAAERLQSLQGELATHEARVKELDAELQDSRNGAGALAGLVALYEELEAQGLDQWVETTWSQLVQTLEQVLTGVPLLRDGLTLAAQSLEQLETSLPTLRGGLDWLEARFLLLAERLQAMEEALSASVEPLQPVLSKVTDFFASILHWLPFGMGDNIGDGLASIKEVLTHIPELVGGTGPLVVARFRTWLGSEQDEGSIQTAVIAPVRSDVLQPAGSLADDLDELGGQVKETLAATLPAHLDARRRVTDKIAQYKSDHGMV